MQKHVAACLGLAVLAAGSLCAQEKAAQPAATPASEQKKLLSPENFLELRSVQDPQFSPDGQRVVFVVSEPLRGEKRIRHIWLYDKKSGVVRQFTQSEADPIDPLGQSKELYRGLKRYNVPTDFVIYPREPHGLQEAKHRVDMQTRMVAWFDKYLKPTN